VLLVTLAACADDTARTEPPRSESLPPATALVPLPTASPVPPPTAPPPFEGAIGVIDDPVRARMPYSWRPGCPVPLADLRLLTLGYWGYDNVAHRGELVVHADQAERVVGVFRSLFDARFPIERMELVDAYGGDDHASTLANNTAGFDCREVVGRPGSWSEHAYGRAIDVNPLVNPYLLDPHVHDPELARYIDRSVDAPGLIQPGDAAVIAFTAAGWHWGGVWSPPDYQHFSASGH
jgi:poly-gamma-glutamate synthesis protein (capsule biosynthesis protein)